MLTAGSPALGAKAALGGRAVRSKTARPVTARRNVAVTPRARIYENILETSACRFLGPPSLRAHQSSHRVL